MPNIVVRPFEDADTPGFSLVRSMTYQGALPKPEPERPKKPDIADFVAEVDGVIQGAFTAIDMTATRGEALLRCAGVCAVAVLPEQRRGGIGSVLMRRGLELMRDLGYDLASLYAFRQPYYRKFGYECCGKSYDLSCPSARLPKVVSDLPIRQLMPDDFGAIRPCYAAFAHRYSGMNSRPHDMFWPKPDGEYPTVYAIGDPIEAYAVLKLDPAFWTEQAIREVVWSTPRGYDGLLTLFHGLAMNKTTLKWTEPGDSPFLARFMDQGVLASRGWWTMYRVLDVPGALSKLRTTSQGSFVLAVADQDLPSNQGPWRVDFEPGTVSVRPSSAAPDLTLDVRQMVQALLGEPSLTDLARLGLVAVHSPKGLAAAANLLPANPTTCMDSF